MDGASHHLLAGARGAMDHDARIGWRDAPDHRAQLVHRLGFAGGAAPQFDDLALQLRGLQRPFCDQDQPIGLERLFDIVVGAPADRRDGGLDIAVARDHDHRHLWMLCLDHVEKIEPIDPASL